MEGASDIYYPEIDFDIRGSIDNHRPGIFGKHKAVPFDHTAPVILKSLFDQKVTPMSARTFHPVPRLGEYIKDLKRTGTAQETIDRIQADHDRWEKTGEVVTLKAKEVANVPCDPTTVVVTISVTKSGRIKVYTGAPMEHIHTTYWSKGTKAPIAEYLKALKKFGYSDSVLLNVLEKHQRREAKSAEMDSFVEAIFGKSNSKASKPKIKSVKDQINSRFKKKR
jgi:hypothetical protein